MTDDRLAQFEAIAAEGLRGRCDRPPGGRKRAHQTYEIDDEDDGPPLLAQIELWRVKELARQRKVSPMDIIEKEHDLAIFVNNLEHLTSRKKRRAPRAIKSEDILQ